MVHRAWARLIADEEHPLGDSMHVRATAWKVPRDRLYPEGVKYCFVLVDRKTGERVIAIDNHGGHGHHAHLRGITLAYSFRGLQQARRDFWEYVERYLGCRR